MNTEPLTFIPAPMQPWGLQLITAEPSEFGAFHLVSVEQASIEGAHQVEVIDEDGRPLRGVEVIFGFPGGGPPINMPVRINHWRDAPRVLQGNGQSTNLAGYVEHTFGEGGEDIWIWFRNDEGDLLYPSDIVRNCTWMRTPVGRFEHTGVLLQFALKRTGVTPAAERLAALEGRVATLETWVTRFEDQLMGMKGK